MHETPLGLAQRDFCKNQDVLHEEIPELDFGSLFVTACHGGETQHLQEKRIVLVGDQNAGKTSFLHWLVDQNDPHSTWLSSFIPAMSRSFVNARFFLAVEEDRTNVMDELPFLDTDLARAAVLLTAENFDFLCMESGCKPAPTTTPFVALEFAEFGGDHLDRLLNFRTSKVSDVGAEILSASCRMLGEADTVAYFVNLASLFDAQCPETAVSSRLQDIRQRVELLATLNPDIAILFVGTRCPDGWLAAADETGGVEQVLHEGFDDSFEPTTKLRILAVMEKVLSDICAQSLPSGRWKFRVGRHMDGNCMHVPGVVRTVASLLHFMHTKD